MSVLNYATTPGDNLSISGINILGTAAVSNFDNAFRQLMADIANGIPAGAFMAVGYVTKAANYAVVVGDKGKVFDCTTDLELDLPAAATAGVGFFIDIKANGGAVTVDPNGTENINGASTSLVIANGTSARVLCDGTAWHSISAIALADVENRIINGAFDFWQRGTSQTASGYGSADRFANGVVGGTVTMSRQAFTLGDKLGKNCPIYFLRQSVSGQSLSSHMAVVEQKVESVRSYSGETITVLGWARRSSGSGNMAVGYDQSFGTGGSPSADVTGAGQTVPLTGSWAPFAVTIAVPSITGKTLGSNNNDHFRLLFWTSAGSDFNARTNSLGIQTIGVDLWGIHIRRGTHGVDAVQEYIAPEIQHERVRCERYCRPVDIQWAGGAVAGGDFQMMVNLVPPMRSTPTAALLDAGSSVNLGTLNTVLSSSRFLLASTATATGNAGVFNRTYLLDAEL